MSVLGVESSIPVTTLGAHCPFKDVKKVVDCRRALNGIDCLQNLGSRLYGVCMRTVGCIDCRQTVCGSLSMADCQRSVSPWTVNIPCFTVSGLSMLAGLLSVDCQCSLIYCQWTANILCFTVSGLSILAGLLSVDCQYSLWFTVSGLSIFAGLLSVDCEHFILYCQ